MITRRSMSGTKSSAAAIATPAGFAASAERRATGARGPDATL